MRLPGSLVVQGIGDPPGLDTPWTGQIVDRSLFTNPAYAPYRRPDRFKLPFRLQPDLVYVGPAWYRREVEVPQEWAGRRLVLFLKRPHWETHVWFDGRSVGANDAPGTPHEYELGLPEPGPRMLVIRMDKRLVADVGHDSHSVSDHTQGDAPAGGSAGIARPKDAWDAIRS